MVPGPSRSARVTSYFGEKPPDLDRVLRLVGLASCPGFDFAAEAHAGRLALVVVLAGVVHRRPGWGIPDDAGYDEAREVTLRAVLELAGEGAMADYRYRGGPAPETRK